MFTSTLPEVLLCQGCGEYAKTQGWAPFNILMCRKPRHAETRAPVSEIRTQFEKYVGKLDHAIDERSLKYSVNFMFQVHSVAPGPKRRTRDHGNRTSKVKVSPCINSYTGLKVKTEKIIPESSDNAFYLMQTLQIGSKKRLVFFDSGANMHLCKGDMAIDENFKLISKKPTSLTVVGGSQIRTEYGMYRFNLGPTSKDEYLEINCIGIDSITTKFKKYDLSHIRSEYLNHNNLPNPTEALPEYSGGTDVDLLLGMKNINVQPTLLQVLPSGIGVYRSVFKDIWGSQIIFAGPHTSFTSTNLGSKEESSLAIFTVGLEMEEKSWKRTREEMPLLPNSRPGRRGQKRRRWRSRSRFREKSVLQMRTEGKVRTELGVDEPDPSGIQFDHSAPEPVRMVVDRSSSEEEVVVMIEDEDEYQEINTPKPVSRKILLDRKKKGRKNAGSGPSVRRSYDERI